MNEKQMRSYCNSSLEIETREDGGKQVRKLKGYAAVFNSRSENLGWYREILMPGSFGGPLREKQDVRALLNHDANLVLARTTNGTLVLSQDDQGLRSEIELPDTQFARDLATTIGRGDINQMSFAFSTRDYAWEVEDGEYVRVVKSVKRLYDVSPVTYPAYQATSVGLRAASLGIPLDLSELVPALMRADEGLMPTKEDSTTIRSAIAQLQKLLDKIDVESQRTVDSDAVLTADRIGERLVQLRAEAVTANTLKSRLNELGR